jgi:predicted metal-binding membrane protein
MPAMPMDCASMPGMAGGPWSAAASFIGMWTLMMAGMMLPSLVPMLRHYHGAVRRGGGSPHLAPLTLVVGAGYFAVWTAAGVIVFALTRVQRETIVPVLAPLAAGIVALLAGGLQFTPWKAHHLACCRDTSSIVGPGIAAAWRHGLRLGRHCSCACIGPMAVLLAAGVMDPRAMAIVTAAITLERIAPPRLPTAKIVGAGFIVWGQILFLARMSWI